MYLLSLSGHIHAGHRPAVSLPEGIVSVAVTQLPLTLQRGGDHTILVAALSLGPVNTSLSLYSAQQGTNESNIHNTKLRLLWSLAHPSLLNNSYGLVPQPPPGFIGELGVPYPIRFLGDVDSNDYPDVIICMPDVDGCVIFLLHVDGVKLSVFLAIHPIRGNIQTGVTPGWCFTRRLCGDADPVHKYVMGADPVAWPMISATVHANGTIYRSDETDGFGAVPGEATEITSPLVFKGQHPLFGAAVETVDINGDGLLDLLITAPDHDYDDGDKTAATGSLFVILMTMRQVPATVTYTGHAPKPTFVAGFPDIGAITLIPLLANSTPSRLVLGRYMAVVGFNETSKMLRLVVHSHHLTNSYSLLNGFTCLSVQVSFDADIPGLPFTSYPEAPLLKPTTPVSMLASIQSQRLVRVSDAAIWPLLTAAETRTTATPRRIAVAAMAATADFTGSGTLFTSALLKIEADSGRDARVLASFDWSNPEYWELGFGVATPITPSFTGFIPGFSGLHDPYTDIIGTLGGEGLRVVRDHGGTPPAFPGGFIGAVHFASFAAFKDRVVATSVQPNTEVSPASPKGLLLTFMAVSGPSPDPGLVVYRHVGHVIPNLLHCNHIVSSTICQTPHTLDGITPMNEALTRVIGPFADPLSTVERSCMIMLSSLTFSRKPAMLVDLSEHIIPRCASSHVLNFCLRNCMCASLYCVMPPLTCFTGCTHR